MTLDILTLSLSHSLPCTYTHIHTHMAARTHTHTHTQSAHKRASSPVDFHHKDRARLLFLFSQHDACTHPCHGPHRELRLPYQIILGELVLVIALEQNLNFFDVRGWRYKRSTLHAVCRNGGLRAYACVCARTYVYVCVLVCARACACRNRG